MEARDYLAYVVDEIHRTIVATVDDDGLPVTAAVDMMDYDDAGLYFLTAKGKNLYDRLKKREFVAFTGMKGEDTTSTVAVSIRGKVKELGGGRLPRIFQKNPYMAEIYPTEQSRAALTVFQIYEGAGEWFDLSKKPIERASFTFGGAEDPRSGYRVTSKCIGCMTCVSVCPQNCIDASATPAVIQQDHCLHCGNCYEKCPQGAVEKR